MELSYVLAAAIFTPIIAFFIGLKISKSATERARRETYEIRSLLESLRQERDMFRDELSIEREKRINAETRVAVSKKELEMLRVEMINWEKNKNEHFKIAKAAMFESGSVVFKEEAEVLNKKFKEVTEKVATLNDNVGKHGDRVETLWSALSTPGGAGQYSEIGLEGTLKRYGLRSRQDYFMQFATTDDDGSNLRPDAIVLLPGGNALVIDCKASKFFFDLAKAKNKAEEDAVLPKLRRTMNEHLRSLATKGYREAVKESIRKSNPKEQIGHIWTIMFVQSEAAIEKLYAIDPEFEKKCDDMRVALLGPRGIGIPLSFARTQISRTQREHKHENIIKEVSNLLGSLEIVLGHAIKVGNGIKSAANNYEKFAASVNKNFLPKARNITEHGVPLPKSKQLPGDLSSIHVHESTPTIDGESEEIREEQPSITSLREAMEKKAS